MHKTAIIKSESLVSLPSWLDWLRSDLTIGLCCGFVVVVLILLGILVQKDQAPKKGNRKGAMEQTADAFGTAVIAFTWMTVCAIGFIPLCMLLEIVFRHLPMLG